MEYELMNVCMECNYEWEENNAVACPKCHCGDFYTYRELDYDELELEDCLSLFRKNILSVCDADLHTVKFEEGE